MKPAILMKPTAHECRRPAKPTTVGKRWRSRRDLVILVTHRAGVSQRLLADVFDLPRSRIGAIVRQLEAEAGGPKLREA